VSAQQAKHYYQKEDRGSPDRQPSKSETDASEAMWFGTGADRLSLLPEIEVADFQKVLEGTTPAGESLSARKVDLETRRAATDFTFSAPKSVSIAALVQGDRRVVEAHDRAVKTVLTVMESEYAQTRIRTEQGQVRVGTDNLLVGIFRHEMSRSQDPQLHSHALVMNCTQLGNGQWRSLSNEQMVCHSKSLGQIYQSELAEQLHDCGYEIVQRENGQFELEGYAALSETFSTRRHQIEAHLAPIEAPTLKQREHAALTTRQAKVQVSTAVLRQRWDSQLATLDLPIPEIPEPINHPDLLAIMEEMVGSDEGDRSDLLPLIEEAVVVNDDEQAIDRQAVENFAGQADLLDWSDALEEETVDGEPGDCSDLLTIMEEGVVVNDEAQTIDRQAVENLAGQVNLIDWFDALDEEMVDVAGWDNLPFPEIPEPDDRSDSVTIVEEVVIINDEIQTIERQSVKNFSEQAGLMNWRDASEEETIDAAEWSDFPELDHEVQTASEGESSIESISLVQLEDELDDGQENGQQISADLIRQLMQTTIRYYNRKLEQGEFSIVDGTIEVVESPDYWVAYYPQGDGETPMLQVQDKATNTPIFEMLWRGEDWKAELIEPEAIAWLEQASRELAMEQRKEAQIQRSQMEL
jgi:conjugative relaxase-like TrwC/TraI family protein